MRLLWLLRHELHLPVSEIRTLRWSALPTRCLDHPRLAQAIADFRTSLATKSFLLHSEAPVFASRKRGVGGRQTPISPQQISYLLLEIRFAPA